MPADFLVAGTKRSGHHAIITWLANQITETVHHHNDILYEPFLEGQIQCKSRPGDSYSGSDVERHIYSMEDISLTALTKLHKPNLTIIVVIRDIRNTLASDLKACNPKTVDSHLNKLVNIWISYADGYLKETPEYFVLFDKWFQDKLYRQKICSDLNVPFTDKGLNKVPNYGGGSSFDKTRFDGKAQNMDVLNRWIYFYNHPLYMKYFTSEVKALNTLIFDQ